MQIPFVGFMPVRTSEHMAALGTSPHNLTDNRNLWTFAIDCVHSTHSFLAPIEDVQFTTSGICHIGFRVVFCSIGYTYVHRNHRTLDRSILLTVGHRIREDPHPYHRLCIRTSAYSMDIILL
jgi:hypothetical protein